MKNDSEAESESGWASVPEDIRGDLIVQVFEELSIIMSHNRLRLLVTHGFIELLVNALVEHHLKNSSKVKSDTRSYPHSSKLLILNELGIIDDDEYKAHDWFRKLRNGAVHQPIFDMAKSDLFLLRD